MAFCLHLAFDRQTFRSWKALEELNMFLPRCIILLLSWDCCTLLYWPQIGSLLKARVALARKLAVVFHHKLRDKTNFIPHRATPAMAA